jgi:hypothetical protein
VSAPAPPPVRHGRRPGLLGDIVRPHSVTYAAEWGFGPRFEIVLAERMAALFARVDETRDRVFHVNDADGHLLGTLTIDVSALAPGHATLRAFVGLDAARRLYESAGFKLAAEAETGAYGTPVLGQTFVWDRSRRRYRRSASQIPASTSVSAAA